MNVTKWVLQYARCSALPAISAQAMQWKPMGNITAVSPFPANNAECFKVLRDAVFKYGALDCFRLSLTHRRFDIADDEGLMQYSDRMSHAYLPRQYQR